MRHGFSLVLVVACMSLLSACNKAVLGPDLAHRPTPFVAQGLVELSDSSGTTKATITARPDGDAATVQFESLGSKPYNATLTYRAFVPIIAESNAKKKDYWLVGVNLSKTADRSFYAILRHPSGRPLEPGTTREDFELRVLDCGVFPKAEDSGTDTKASEAFSYEESDSLCIFDNIAEVERHASRVLQQDDIARRDALTDPKEAPADRWNRVTVHAF